MDEAHAHAKRSASNPRRSQSPPIDGQVLKQLLEAGLTWLRANQQTVNALNVFPVPDGDTGTNMVLTMQAAYAEIAASTEHNSGKVAHAIAHGALMGARGNSGVILSQLWRGFARTLDNLPVLDSPTLVQAFAEARDTAYKGVVRPVEGTILTVAKDIAAAAQVALAETTDMLALLEWVVIAADESVQRTPDLLEDHRRAGVVDAGGKGLFYILEGMLRYLRGQPLEAEASSVRPLAAMNLANTLENIEPGQDYEVVVDFRPETTLDLPRFYAGLEKIGTSIQIGEGDGLYRMHIHVSTENLYAPIDYTRSLGSVSKVAIENLMEQMQAIEQKSRPDQPDQPVVEPGQIAVVAVAPGAGLARVFRSLGAAAIVDGGQTMNPSTQNILQALENLPTDKVVILPNNKNIVLAAKAAAGLTAKRVAVVPSHSAPQGLAAMLRLAPEGDFESVVAEMTAALDDVQTAEITTAIRDAEIDGVTVHKGEIIALLNDQLVVSSPTLVDGCLKTLEKAGAADFELLTIFYGANISRAETDQIVDQIRAAYPNLEIEVQEGGQPHYQFIFSLE